MKTYTPSEKVLNCVSAIKDLNKNHNGGITGIWISLIFGDRYTKEEIKYMKAEISKPEKLVYQEPYFGTYLGD